MEHPSLPAVLAKGSAGKQSDRSYHRARRGHGQIHWFSVVLEVSGSLSVDRDKSHRQAAAFLVD